MENVKIDNRVRSDEPGDMLGGSAGIMVERRNPRTFVEVALDFRLIDGEKTYQGVKLSRCLLTVKLPPRQRLSDVDTKQGLARGKVQLRLPLSGFELALEVEAVPLVDGRAGRGMLQFVIAPGEVHSQAILAQIVRSALTGVLPTVDDLTLGHDEETPQAGPAQPVTGTTERRRFAPVLFLAGSVLALTLAAGAYGKSLWAAATTVSSEVARFAAPHNEILSLDYGRAVTVAVARGDRVGKGQMLLKLERNGKETIYRSPCDCAVSWMLDAEDTVAPGTALALLVEDLARDRHVLARIPAARESEVHPGQTARVEAIRGGPVLEGKVEAIGRDIGGLERYERQDVSAIPPDTVPVLIALAPGSALPLDGAPARVAIAK